MVGMGMLPEECISYIISFTSPMDACRSARVCRLFRSAADSDVVWERFLPHDILQILSDSDLASSMHWLSKKKLFFRLSHCPILVGGDRNRSFAIDKRSGKKCYMSGARRLSIARGNAPYWQWIQKWRQSRFYDVAKLDHVWWFKIVGRIETNILSQKTTYTAYFVYKLEENSSGFHLPITKRVYFKGQGESNRDESTCTLDIRDPTPPPLDRHNLPQVRGDGWMEIEIGEFYNDCGDAGLVICRLYGLRAVLYSGIVVEGIELRPKA
ncbi:hypothetical protein FNV43_RR02309 [Rhamnella rubrinervis]|uniref:F-box domain-containing protein n=1 Tax=Rhamnella rubrinervis TaxID=2594499 RepID=A0A8K0HR89_9ROSA|nr:hypothetical protein FNV43_RR02309 [Rhamnella rubrinervis]